MISGIDYIMQLEQEIEKQRRYVKEEKEKKKELQIRIDKAIECIKNRNTTKSKKERFMSGETTLEKVLEILGDK